MVFHAVECQSDVDWECSRIIVKVRGLRQRKVLELLREEHQVIRILLFLEEELIDSFLWIIYLFGFAVDCNIH